MTTPLDALAETIGRALEMWSDDDAAGLTSADLMGVHDALGRARRLLDAAHARIASEIARRSRPELGADSLAKAQGFRNPTALIAATTGTTGGDAARLVAVGDATTPRSTLSGQPAPARHPHVASALARGEIGAPAAAAIIRMLDRVALRAGREAADQAECSLGEQAPALSLDQLARVILRVEAWIDPDGVAPREAELRDARSVLFREEGDGMVVMTARLDPEHAAPLKVAIDALVGAELRARRDAADSGDVDSPRHSIAQLQADALCRLAEHGLGCAGRDLPLGGATVVVRVALEQLECGTGHATIDGLGAPISIRTARRMAADAGVIPCVLGADSEILDWGRTKRLFSPAKKLALIERDGGCAMCGAPPGHSKVHHIRWWVRDAGPTDLDNGVLLCESCHQRIHDNGWEIRIDGRGVDARVWFIPPPYIDATRTPRAGMRARYRLAS